ncbi:hypothetical protein BCY86_00740 [Pajaroellobacter abortibovis]|uniref:Uncharacterized protein n=1 Tax=Pajaroellobacter abortibovis TaxID=1882918 RepID=A0A1L6MV77_9BACT|nr:hypothetical protein BCY86_00740 [Pajaroellobacter abortibovis]
MQKTTNQKYINDLHFSLLIFLPRKWPKIAFLTTEVEDAAGKEDKTNRNLSRDSPPGPPVGRN